MSPDCAPVRLLHVEDSELDHALVCAELAAAGWQVQWSRVETLEAVEQALATHCDAVICDFELPSGSGLEVLRWLRQRDRWLPFVLVSGAIGEDLAVQAMREGASDYLLKGRLARLAPALGQAMSAANAQRERFEALQALRDSREQLSALAAHLQQRIEAERAQLSRELHDDVGSALTALKFDLGWLQRHLPDGPCQARSEQALQVLDGAIAASRRLMLNLRPPILEEGLLASLQWLCERFERQHVGVSLRFSHPQERAPELPAQTLLVAFRFVQEALHNISKHAAAAQVRVDLQWAGEVLGVEVQDDGQGFALDDTQQGQRFGLRGLRERAETAGGWVDVSSRPGRGTLLALSLPLQQQASHPAWEVAA